MSVAHLTTPANSSKAKTAASMLPVQERIQLAVQAMAGTSITHLARSVNTSRKFVYTQAQKARQALDGAFSQIPTEPVYPQVSQAWLRAFVVALPLVCHSSYRGVCEILRDFFNTDISVGKVHNIMMEAIAAARQQNEQEDLSAITVGAHDEIFQGRAPVLVGCDVHSTYCYLLSSVESRDTDTWGISLLEAEQRGLKPNYTIGDGGQGLRAGQAEVWPEIHCHSDVFHALQDLGKAAIYLENRAYGALATKEELERKMVKIKKKARGNQLSKKLGCARRQSDLAIALSDDIDVLLQWIQKDILNLIGADLFTREGLFDFIVDELKAREEQAPHRIGPVRRKLENQRKDLLRFAGLIDRRLAEIARSYEANEACMRQILLLDSPDLDYSRKAQLEEQARLVLRHQFYFAQQEIREMLREEVVRASSVVENLNSRLRNYFFLRKQIGSPYLDLMRFFLNHHRFMRSEHPEREGKSPRELMTGASHAHWWDLLGFSLSKQAA